MIFQYYLALYKEYKGKCYLTFYISAGYDDHYLAIANNLAEEEFQAKISELKNLYYPIDFCDGVVVSLSIETDWRN